jgi:pimeloyl-ACP methyl ester carboxylesterase
MKRLLVAFLLLVLVAFVVLKGYDRPPLPPGGWLAALGLEERFATVDGVRVRYVRVGRGGSAVVLLHGFASSIYTWKDVIPALARDHEVVALDLPGFGWSDQPAGLSFDLYPRVVLGLMDQLGLSQGSLVGNSLGGAVAVVVAATQGARVDRLVLIDAAGFNLRAADRPAMVRLASHPLAEAILSRLPLRRLAVTVGLRQVFHDDTKITEERTNEYLAAASRPGTLASIRSLALSQRLTPEAMEELLRRITAPTLVVWGGEDAWIPVSHADRFLAAIPGARKVVLPDVGHTPEEETPDEVARLLLEFLAKPGA